ncbi:M14 family zinc carboxypeptidase [Gramella sp. MAR_2010_147]|uniref:M14 family zinc carboxypeptidase n=1 Tax=Gramella sp. MAR_2010_147 TaxID=1250205 RepID=UPI001E57970E|nr:M14 family zinc carboxypeptidase [Gramella sp. MAR_2010_147]
MKNLELRDLFEDDSYNQIKFKEVTGRYVTNSSLEIVRDLFKNDFEVEELGKSVENRPVYKFRIGTGKLKVLIWSQMHGNESTTTKAVFDLLNSFKLNSEEKVISGILSACTIYVIPVLNPDGAQAYTRVNANSVDLNRDLQDLSQPESRLLKGIYEDFQPDFCLNLHDQRTIFSAGKKAESAILSFLTPSKDKERSIDYSRRQSMSLIAGMAKDLYAYLPESIGRYDDAFNINCAGDTFQNLSTPTILFEAGHTPGDYDREVTRKHVYRALLSCIYQIAQNNSRDLEYEEYFKIPENQKLFNDVIIRNAKINGKLKDVSIQFKETLNKNKIEFVPVIERIAPKISNFGHREIDAEENVLEFPDNSEITENVIVNKIILNSAELEVKYG